jgi:hypothetical protein
LLFSWTFIPAIIGFIEGIIYLVMSDNDLEEKYGGGAYEGQPAFIEEKKHAHNAPNKLKRQPWYAVSVAINSRSRKCCPRQPRSGGSLDCSFTPLCAVALARKGPAVCGSCRRNAVFIDKLSHRREALPYRPAVDRVTPRFPQALEAH